ncbi:MAG: ester cyclase [Trebonia sp.]|uniref:ester cyclase n=1 Tax=Trebonia sp. TaxID=2767075 RepID=UPI003BB148F0
MNTPADPPPQIQQSQEREATSAGQGKILLRRLIEEVINQGKLGVIDELFSPDLAAAVRQGHTAFRTAFSDWRMELIDVIAEGDKVVGRFTCSGTHTGPWLGARPTGRRFEQVDEIAILRVRDNRFIDYWVLEDNAARMQQLGITATR